MAGSNLAHLQRPVFKKRSSRMTELCIAERHQFSCSAKASFREKKHKSDWAVHCRAELKSFLDWLFNSCIYFQGPSVIIGKSVPFHWQCQKRKSYGRPATHASAVYLLRWYLFLARHPSINVDSSSTAASSIHSTLSLRSLPPSLNKRWANSDS